MRKHAKHWGAVKQRTKCDSLLGYEYSGDTCPVVIHMNIGIGLRQCRVSRGLGTHVSGGRARYARKSCCRGVFHQRLIAHSSLLKRVCLRTSFKQLINVILRMNHLHILGYGQRSTSHLNGRPSAVSELVWSLTLRCSKYFTKIFVLMWLRRAEDEAGGLMLNARLVHAEGWHKAILRAA